MTRYIFRIEKCYNTNEQVKELALGKTLNQSILSELNKKKKGPVCSFGKLPGSMAHEGWGVILHASLDLKTLHARLDALGELLDRRQSLAGGRFKIYSGLKAFKPSDTKKAWRWITAPHC